MRAFFHIVYYVCIADPTMFDFQTAIAASEKVFAFVQRTYQGKSPSCSVLRVRVGPDEPRIREHMRMGTEIKLKKLVLNGSLWEIYWTSYYPNPLGPRGAPAILDAPLELPAEMQWGSDLAAMAQCEREHSRRPENQKGRPRGQNQGNGGKSAMDSAGEWSSNGTTKRKRTGKGKGRWGKGQKWLPSSDWDLHEARRHP